jgi:hypothetical protein
MILVPGDSGGCLRPRTSRLSDRSIRPDEAEGEDANGYNHGQLDRG